MNPKKKALGRGLSALLDTGTGDVVTTSPDGKDMVWSHASIPVSRIESNPYQPRTNFEEESLVELAQSLKEQGIIQPITVRRMGYDRFQLISGERRLRAAQIAQLTNIPAFIRTADDTQMLEMALVENIQRKDLNSIEVAISFQRLIEELNYSQETLSEKVGKNRTTITNYLRLLKLPPEIQIAVRDEKISMGHARALITLDDKETQLDILRSVLQKGLSVRDVEKLVRQSIKGKKRKSPNPALPARVQSLKSTLEQQYGTGVAVRRNKNGSGNLRIPFRSDDELDKIIRMLL